MFLLGIKIYELNVIDILNCYANWPKIRKAIWITVSTLVKS